MRKVVGHGMMDDYGNTGGTVKGLMEETAEPIENLVDLAKSPYIVMNDTGEQRFLIEDREGYGDQSSNYVFQRFESVESASKHLYALEGSAVFKLVLREVDMVAHEEQSSNFDNFVDNLTQDQRILLKGKL